MRVEGSAVALAVGLNPTKISQINPKIVGIINPANAVKRKAEYEARQAALQTFPTPLRPVLLLSSCSVAENLPLVPKPLPYGMTST